jgi:hypothetical protein
MATTTFATRADRIGLVRSMESWRATVAGSTAGFADVMLGLPT